MNRLFATASEDSLLHEMSWDLYRYQRGSEGERENRKKVHTMVNSLFPSFFFSVGPGREAPSSARWLLPRESPYLITQHQHRDREGIIGQSGMWYRQTGTYFSPARDEAALSRVLHPVRRTSFLFASSPEDIVA